MRLFLRLLLITNLILLFSLKASAVIEGRDASLGEYPEFTQIRIFNGDFTEVIQMCSGTLIAPDKILTSASCAQANIFSYVMIPNFYSYDDTLTIEDQFRATSIVSHPEFDPITLENDVAIITLNTFNKPDILTTPASIHIGSATFNELTARAVGAGTGSNNAEPASGIIQEVDVPVTSNDLCNASYQALQNESPITEQMMCTGFTDTAKGACIGDNLRDNGGPLWLTIEGVRTLVGVASFGVEPCEENRATQVYARLAKMVIFIQEQSPETSFINVDETITVDDPIVIAPITNLLLQD